MEQVQSNLSSKCLEVMLGSLLGDASLKRHEGYRNARFSFKHSVRQEEYFFWKVKSVKEVSSSKDWWYQGEKDPSGKKVKKIRYQSAALPALTDIYDRTTDKGGDLSFEKEWLKLLTPLSLAIWWMDDGSIITNGRKGVFCTDSFDYENQVVLSNYLKDQWKVDTKVGKVGQKHHRLYIYSPDNLKDLLRIIMPHVPVEVMLPKILLLYKDTSLQQRWISEVVSLTDFSLQKVQQALIEKKKRWKDFRE